MKSSIAPFVASIAALLAVAAAGPAPAASFRSADLGLAPAATSVPFIVKLPLRNRAELEALTALQATPDSPLYHHFLSVEQFRARYGPTPDSIRRAALALVAEGFRVTAVNSQSIEATGTAAAVRSAFNVRMHLMRTRLGGARPATTDTVQPPPALATLGVTVIGLNGAAMRRSHLGLAVRPDNRTSTVGSYWFDDLKQAYAYPSYSAANGSRVKIATVGISDFNQRDAQLYFQHERLGTGAGYLAPQPTLYHVMMTGSQQWNAQSADSIEANLDVQQAGGSAPAGASVIGIATDGYDSGFIAAYTAIADKKPGYGAQVVSTSYGVCELTYTAPYGYYSGPPSVITQGYHDVFLQGNAEGITFTTSSGDNAGLDCPQPGYFTNGAGGGRYLDVAGVDADADDPNVVAVGGTNLITTHSTTSLTSAYSSENAYDNVIGVDDPYQTGNEVTNELWGSGSGASQFFAKPSWQNDIPTGVTRRSVPDVSMQMGGCPVGAVCSALQQSQASSVSEYFGGTIYEVVGTSAASPEFAGLLAERIAATHALLGNVNVEIYAMAAANATTHDFHQGIPGTNGVVTVKAGTLGYSRILGVGTPYGANFAGLPTAPLAGIPQTATNP